MEARSAGERLEQIQREHRHAMATRRGPGDSWLNGYQDDVGYLLAALAASQEKERQHRIEADAAMRDYEALELVVQKALDLLLTGGSKLETARALGEAETLLRESLHGDGPAAALDSTQTHGGSDE